MKNIAALTVGGLLIAGAVVAATKPALTPVAPLREPTVKIKAMTGVAVPLYQIGDHGEGLVVTGLGVNVTDKKGVVTNYVYNLDADTQYYYRNGATGSLKDIANGDTVEVWSVKVGTSVATGGTAIKVWDKKLWNGKKTVWIGDDLDTSAMTMTMKSTKTAKTTVYAAHGTADTVIVKQVVATTNTPASETPKTWTDLTKGMKVTATGLWNDQLKSWSLTKIVILAAQ